MKKIFSLLVLIMSVLILVGCSQSYEVRDDIDQQDSYVSTENYEVTEPNRKLIYKVRLTIATNDLNQVINKVKQNLNADEWFDSEAIYNDYATLVIRVKTSRLDNYLSVITKDEKTGNFEKTATDVSNQYQSIETQIESLELQIERLLALYENASVSEMITINQQLSNAQSSLKRLQGELSNFDSLVEYSTVTLHITKNSQAIKEEGFFNQVKNAFLEGITVIIEILKGLVIAIVFLVPVLVVAAPVSFGIYKIYKYRKSKINKNHKDN